MHGTQLAFAACTVAMYYFSTGMIYLSITVILQVRMTAGLLGYSSIHYPITYAVGWEAAKTTMNTLFRAAANPRSVS